LNPGIGSTYRHFRVVGEPEPVQNWRKHYRVDREGARTKGGVAILVRQTLSHSLLSSFQTKVLECIGISVSSSTGSIPFISTYPPGGRSEAPQTSLILFQKSEANFSIAISISIFIIIIELR
jgi:hypothetical protein